MTDNQKKINELLARLETLLQRQEGFQQEINNLRSELNSLRQAIDDTSESQTQVEQKATPDITPQAPVETEEPIKAKTVITNPVQEAKAKQPFPPLESKPRKKDSNLEKFIGENLISKIGIVITIIGVGIGVNYAIDHELITPLMRVILGYGVGAALLVFSLVLRKKYENFSAVLISGSVSIAYFITYAAFSFYSFIPRIPAFAMMVLLTIAAVYIAISYGRQIIAMIGLVGAYAVPFLLSDGSGNYLVLFTYVAIINAGILVIAFRKYWKLLFNTAFILTWLIYVTWFTLEYKDGQHTQLALGFSLLFFIIFYATFLANKLLKKRPFHWGDIVFVMANGFIYYGMSYLALDYKPANNLLGLFTVINAIFHLVAAGITYKRKADDKLFYLLLGIALIFITIAIPVQLDGSWVTLLWAGEAALLYWIGRSRSTRFYEQLSYLLVFAAFFSLTHDWADANRFYNPELPDTYVRPFLNIHFLNSVLFSACFAFISYISSNKKYEEPEANTSPFRPVMNYVVGGIFIVAAYHTFAAEISMYWNQLYADSILSLNPDIEHAFSDGLSGNHDFTRFKYIWLVNYTMAFLTILSFTNIRKLKNKAFGWLNMVLNILALLLLFVWGFEVLGNLRESYLNNDSASVFNIGMRYISFALGGLLVYACHDYLKRGILGKKHPALFDAILHIFILAIASNELVTWLEVAGSGQSHKLGLSILWGVYSLLLIIMGIAKRKQHLRIGAMILFGITLIKLFFYDLSHLSTISKTIVFVSLGVLLLVISFLYNKFKGNMFDTEESKNTEL